MLLDYSVPEFQVLIGDLDVSRLITKFEIGRPIFEMGDSLCWRGDFELAYSPLQTAITENQLSSVTNPLYFRPNQKLCQFLVKNFVVCKFYIERYTYDRSTRTGQASIYQLLAISEGERVSEEIETILSEAGTPLYTIIRNSITTAFLGSLIVNPVVLIDDPGHTGTVDDRVTADDPIKQAYDFASKNWRWLWVDTNNQIKDVSGDHTLATVVLARSQTQCEIQEVFDNINFDAQHVIVTGSKKGLSPPSTKGLPVSLPGDAEELLDEDNRELVKKVETHAAKWLYYPELYAKKSVSDGSTVYSKPFIEEQFLYERKTIEYKYWGVNPSSFFRIPDLTSIGKEYIPQISDFANSWKFGELVQTVTTIERARGAVEAKYNAGSRIEDNTMIPFVRYVETDWCKLTYATPLGSIFLGIVTSFSFLESEELTLVDAEPITQNRTDPDGSKPNIPEKKLVKKEIPEELQDAPDLELIDYILKGEAFFQPVGWTPFRQKPLIVDVGFLPDQEHADYLAQQIGLREIRRRDAVFVTMPIPLELLQNGFVPLQKAFIHDGEYQIDEEIISLEEGQLKYAFTGGKIGSITPILDPPKPIPYQPGDTFFLINQIQQTIKNQAVSIQLELIGGTLPYSFSGTLPTGLSLSPSGLITGVPTSVSSLDYTITVVDAASVSSTVILKFSVVSDNPAIVSDLVYSELIESVHADSISEFLFAADNGVTTNQELVDLVITPANNGVTSNQELNDEIDVILESVQIDQETQLVSTLLDSAVSNQIVQFVTPLIDGVTINQIVQAVTPLTDGVVSNQLNA